ncbi:MAG: hypothetical protein C4516_05830 [Oxalobacter sp.]|nr:MAG: hypothetical protein C4516_05830 [Oxalobacter sp.]
MMVKKFLTAITLLVTATLVAANPTIEAVNNQWTFSLGKQRMDYHEYDNYDDVPTRYLDSETGSQPAFAVSYVRQMNTNAVENLYLKGAMAFAHGETRYNGYLYNSGTGVYTPYRTTTDTTTFDLEGKIGKGFAIGRQAQLTPYVNLSFHEWIRDMSDDPYGYKEIYWHYAYGVGVLGQYAFSSHLVAHLDASIGRTTLGRMWADDTDNTYHLGARPVKTLDVGLTYLIDKKWSVHGGYRLTKFEYGESPVVHGYYEPESTTKLQTIYLGLGWRY